MKKSYPPLSKNQKATICQLARQAWENTGAARDSEIESAAADPFGMADSASKRFAAWRREEQIKAVGVGSLTACKSFQYRKLMHHFLDLKRGKPVPVPSAGEDWPVGDAPANLWDDERGPQLRKIGKLLVSGGRAWEYGHGLARRMAKVERLDWCDSRQLRLIILALNKDHERHA